MIRLRLPDVRIISQQTPVCFGLYFDDVLSGNVDVSISGLYITTIIQTITPTTGSANVGFPFAIKTNTTISGYLPFTITVSADGYDDVTFEVIMSDSDDTVDTTYNYTPVLTLLDGVCNFLLELPTFTNVNTKRLALAADIFKDTSGVYPSGAPFSINTNPAGANGVSFDHGAESQKRLLTMRENDSQGYYWESYVGWVRNVANGNILVIDSFGHGEPGHQELYEALMNAGYDYMNCDMAYVTENPNITESFATNRHNQILSVGIDNAGYDGRRLHLFDKIAGLTYILSQKSYTYIVLNGISGGAQLGLIWAALDTRINKSMLFRGTGIQSMPFGGGDFEQGTLRLFNNLATGASGPRVSESLRNHSRVDMAMLGCAGGRELHWVNHLTDSCCWKGYYSDLIKPAADIKAAQLGGIFVVHHFTSPLTASHEYHPDDDIAYILANI